MFVRALQIVAGLACAFASLFLIGALIETMNPATAFNTSFIDSIFDKIMWVSLILGCSVGYAVGAITLLIGKLRKFMLWPTIISAGMFFAGIYYHFILGSPW